MGERAVRFAPEEGADLVDVCPLCQEIALEHGWLKEGTPTTPTIPGDRRRRRRGRGLPELLGLRRSTAADAVTPPEPILRRLSEDELALLEAADLFNGSTYRRTVGGLAKSLRDAPPRIWRSPTSSIQSGSDDLLRDPTRARRRALRQDGRVLQGQPERDGDHRPPRRSRPSLGRGCARVRREAGDARPSPSPHPGHIS